MASLTETTDYGNFDPEYYMKTYKWSATGEHDDEDFIRFNLDASHDIFNSGGIKGQVLLDIGTGPTIKSLVSACVHVDEIYMYISDVNQGNRAILTDWWKSDGTFESELTDYILEKENASDSIAERQDMLKTKIRGILPIDIRAGHPLGKGDHPGQFDVITTWLCLEAASQTAEEYRKVVQNVASLLKVGGHLVLMGLLNNEHYQVGNFNFLCASLSQEETEHIYITCGFRIINVIRKILDKDHENNLKTSKWGGHFAMHAVKIS